MLARLVAASALALPLAAQTVVYAPQASDAGSFGTSVDVIGDFDGDGVDDFAVGEPNFDVAFLVDSGRVQVFSGATGAVLFTETSLSNGARLGFDLDGGDLNDDGFADLLVTAPGASTFFVYAGPDGTAIDSGSIAGPEATFSCAFVGDQNGDGFPDCAFGAPFATNPNTTALEAGRVRVLDLVFGNPIAEVIGEQPGGRLGWSVDGGVDLDEDGDPEVLVGQPGFDSFFGTDNGRVIAYDVAFLQMTEVLERTGPFLGQLGTAVAVGGDVDGDGQQEFLAGAPFANGTGEVFVYTGPSATFVRSHAGTQADEQFGASLSFVGDADADGYDDYVIGAPLFDAGSPPFAVLNVGRAQVRSGWTGDVVTTLSGANPQSFLGTSVGGGSDVDLDGWNEVLAGEPGNGGGRAVLFTALDGDATTSSYGPGLGGAGGEPALVATDPPVLGDTTTLLATNTTGGPATGTVVLGFAPSQTPFKAATLLVSSPFQTISVPLPEGTTPLPYPVPNDPSLVDVSIYLQLVFPDATAPKNLAFSPGLRLTHGS